MRVRGLPRLPLTAVVLALPWIPLVVAARKPITDNSFLWHVAVGRGQIDQGSVYTADPLSFTMAGAPWRTQSWLVELGYGFLDRGFGLHFVPWMIGSVGIIAFLGLALVANQLWRRPLQLSFFVASSIGALLPFLVPRPALFGFALFALVLVASRDERLCWTIPLLFWLWAAIHGSFVVGLGFLGLQWLRERSPLLLRGTVAAGFATLLTAHGWGVVEILIAFFRNRDALEFITEWQTPDLLGSGFPILLLVGLNLWGAVHGQLKRRDLWLVLPFVALGADSIRSMPLGWIGASPATARAAETLPGRVDGRTRSVISTVILVGVISLPVIITSPFRGLHEERFPIEVLRAGMPESRLFHDDIAGGYIAYAFWPAARVFIDDRAELFGEEFYREFMRARRGDDVWRTIFWAYGVEGAVLREEEGLYRELLSEGWDEARRDEGWVVLVRQR